MISQAQIHATVISIDSSAIALRGPSGSGKSDLGLRLISDGAILVADDRCDLSITKDTITAAAPIEIAGIFEVRGLGIFRLDYLERARLRLVVDLCEPYMVERMPKKEQCIDWGIPIPLVRLTPFEASAANKVQIALRHAIDTLKSIS